MTNVLIDPVLKRFAEYLDKAGYSDQKDIDAFKSALENLPFDYLERILSKWAVQKNEQNTKILEDVCVGNNRIECDEQTKRVLTYYKTKRHHKYNADNGKLKRKPKSEDPKVDDYLDTVCTFLNNGELNYALTIVDIISVLVERATLHEEYVIDNLNTELSDNLSHSKKALGLFKEFLEMDKYYVQNVKDSSATKDLCKDITKESIRSIDGAIALAREIGINEFIQYAIEQCYFFEPGIVTVQMDKIVVAFEQYKQGNSIEAELHARSSNKVNSREYGQHVDYVRTAIGYAKKAIEKASEVENKDNESEKKKAVNAALEKLEIAKKASNKANRDDIKTKVDAAEKKVMTAANNVYNQNVQDIEKAKEQAQANAEKKLKDSEYCLFHSSDLNSDYPVIIDSDGNKAVREKIITKMTGYTVSAGKKAIFQNYKISHVWGRAFDPRYFTNLWNIVIVPSWANDLLDKPNAIKGSLESKLQSTIMRICEVLYFNLDCIDDTLWKNLDLSKPEIINKNKNGLPIDVIKPKTKVEGIVPKEYIPQEMATNDNVPYLINIIKSNRDDNDEKIKELGDIVKYAVYV